MVSSNTKFCDDWCKTIEMTGETTLLDEVAHVLGEDISGLYLNTII